MRLTSFLHLLFLTVATRAFTSPTPARRTASASLLSGSASSSNDASSSKTAVIAGATGYIGRAVVRESVRRGWNTIALVRDARGAKRFPELEGANIVECDVTNAEQLNQLFGTFQQPLDAIVSCLASRSGVKKDAYLIDYQATLNCLNAGRVNNAKHFVLLSAFCVKNPWLQFQQAKLKFEAELQAQADMSYSIVRPTAFFKSVSGQLEVVQKGSPYVMFGDGQVTRCNPIAESDLACYLLDTINDTTRHNRIINLGGPDEPLTMRKQGEMLFKALNMEPKYFQAPLWLFDVIINTLQFLANVTGSEALEDAAETGRIGKYYAVEDMLTTDPSEKYGTITLQEHYNRIAVEGQEYDPYTSMFSKIRVGEMPDFERKTVKETV